MAGDVKYPSRVMCPLIDEMLSAGDCVAVTDITDGFIKERVLQDRFKEKENWREICLSCDNRKYVNSEA